MLPPSTLAHIALPQNEQVCASVENVAGDMARLFTPPGRQINMGPGVMGVSTNTTLPTTAAFQTEGYADATGALLPHSAHQSPTSSCYCGTCAAIIQRGSLESLHADRHEAMDTPSREDSILNVGFLVPALTRCYVLCRTKTCANEGPGSLGMVQQKPTHRACAVHLFPAVTS
ncbi:hypothetical protein BP6252_03882 [Coleophoma cylindrospora]|uniref:Uncharacterized protein n=1 Tax=Coleophoma cylindrospora TaxID=1849047 RepID=A0A3D8S952_9HELO|nr:hypothetical protein BP6252_03882 [Coleophoma cylindrospora]